MNILFLGAPGCGKGTQSKMLIKEFGIPQISTGDLLREEIKAGSSLGQELQEIMSTGKFVSDELVLSLVSKKIMQGHYPINSALPSLRQLCQLEKISMTTALACYRYLEQLGYVCSSEKRGFLLYNVILIKKWCFLNLKHP